MSEKPSTRDREGTMRRFVEAAAQVLAREGPSGLGVNAVAAEAGADKKLIYRYFGGLDGLVEAMGAETALWLGDPPADIDAGATYGERMAGVLQAYSARLRQDLLLQKLLAWELAEPDDTLRRMDLARSRGMQKLLPSLRGGSAPPEGVDAPAINAVLLAALQYLVLRGGSMGGFAGLKLQTDRDWTRVQAAMERLLDGAYGSGPDKAQEDPARRFGD
jgi:AcrR family transcriptional regulator